MALSAHETRVLARSLAGADFRDLAQAVAYLGGSRPLRLIKEDYRALCRRLGLEDDGPVRVLSRRLKRAGREFRKDPGKVAEYRRKNRRASTVVFLDMGTSFLDAVRDGLRDASTGAYAFEYVTGLVDRLPRENTAFVSPANGLGFMRGGIDGAYAEMFPGVEGSVQAVMKSTGYYPLPVGNGVPVEIDREANTWLVACPTMPRPGMYVGDTRNAQSAFRASLIAFDQLVDRYGVDRLIVPGMCTGVGGMSIIQCAEQIKAALNEHLA